MQTERIKLNGRMPSMPLGEMDSMVKLLTEMPQPASGLFRDVFDTRGSIGGQLIITYSDSTGFHHMRYTLDYTFANGRMNPGWVRYSGVKREAGYGDIGPFHKNITTWDLS